MRRLALIALLALAVLALLGGAATATAAKAKPRTLHLTLKDSGRVVSVRRLERISVRLPANPTTGYLWLREKDGLPELGLQTFAYLAPKPVKKTPIAGRGGTELVVYKALHRGRALIRLIYAHPWDHAHPAHVFKLTVKVR